MLINGASGNTINAEDRGLSYGDGVLRTLRMQAGRPVCWERQYAKLQQDCNALKIFCPSALVLFCELRLGHQPLLAGIKHLNRLENVLASSEWQGQDVQEGLLNDITGNVIGGTRSNLFMLRGNILYTPNLSRCGVAGVQRARVLDWAKQHGVTCNVADIR